MRSAVVFLSLSSSGRSNTDLRQQQRTIIAGMISKDSGAAWATVGEQTTGKAKSGLLLLQW